ncbi:hypothetical protein Vadar_034537 [Vaccinium darrowii]|uniref:Uncharacterized protein n=1 Tax=Vaccinium darrowii TaxID=229202 RepID=A0ACB7Z9F9_9ERIC|nr:hypothetical protein Vadar_034537 [Vaccinium darrowii]
MASEKSLESVESLVPKESSAITKKGTCSAISYMACAVLLVLFNKAAVSSFDFPCANVITLLQMTSSCLLLYALKYWKIISFEHAESEEESISCNPATLVPLKTLVHTLPLALSYLLYMVASMESVRGISVPMYTTVRRTTVAFTMVMEYIFVGQKHSLYVVCRGDLEMTMNFPYLLFPGFQVVMLLSCILAFLLNYSVFLNTTLNSALTQTICGNLKSPVEVLQLGSGGGSLSFASIVLSKIFTNKVSLISASVRFSTSVINGGLHPMTLCSPVGQPQ